MTYAIIEMGGKQYRVSKGDSVLVDRVDAKEGSKLSPRALLYCGDKTVLEGSDLGKVKVDAVVAEHVKGEKIRVFKYRPKKRYKRAQGHRSLLTRLEIGDIRLGGAERRSAPKARDETKAAATERKRPAARSPASSGGGRAAAAKKESGGARKPAAPRSTRNKPDSKDSS